MSTFYQKHFLKLLDFTPAEINTLLQLASQLKADKKKAEVQKLTGKTSRSSSKKTPPAHDALSKLPHLTRRSRHLPQLQRQPNRA